MTLWETAEKVPNKIMNKVDHLAAKQPEPGTGGDQNKAKIQGI